MSPIRNLIGASLVGCLAAGCAPATRLPPGRWIDLTYDYSEQTVYWPTAEPFKLTSEFDGVTNGGYYFRANRYCASEHGGTHVDAPAHFCKTGRTLDQVPVEQWIGAAIVIDVSDKTLRDRDYRATVADFTAWETAHGRIPNDAIVLLRTGHGRYWPDLARYLGTAERGKEAVAKLHFPGLHPDTGRWLVSNRRIKAFGLDTASIDYGQSKLFEVHQILFAADIVALENIANLERLPPTGAFVFALPMKIKGGSGGSARIVALTPQ